MKPEVASRRIESFGQRFGEAHLYLAYHAAFPLALTPDLLYRLWANFQRDIHRQELKIPWLAAADLLLSSLCDEVGHELYEMDTAVRNALLRELKENPRFGEKRISELSDFLLTYVRQQLDSYDPDIRDFAQAQRWTALAYTQPSETARELALILSKLKLEEKAEWVRMASLVETFAEPLADFQPLLLYSRGMQNFARGNLESASAEFGNLSGVDEYQVYVVGVKLPIPDQIASQIASVDILKSQENQVSEVDIPAQVEEENLSVYEQVEINPNTLDQSINSDFNSTDSQSRFFSPDYSHQNLRGRSFKGRNLSGANFSYSDIRGADFSDAILRSANFTHIKAGSQLLGFIGETKFRGADLTDANFTNAFLKNVDFRNALIFRTCWFNTKELDSCRFDKTYLEDSQIKKLLVTGNGTRKNFDQKNLEGVYLNGVNLKDASLIGTNLNYSTLQDADMSRAKLVRTQLVRADLTNACLTGAYIQDWNISSETRFNGVQCEYIYRRLPTIDDPDPYRIPDNLQEVFEPGGFTDWIAPLIQTLDLYVAQGVDPRALALSFKQLAQNNPNAELEIVAIEKRGDDKILLRAKTTATADKSELSAEYFDDYNQLKALSQSQQLLLIEKSDQIRNLENMITTALGFPKSYIQGNTIMSDISGINIQGSSNVSGIAGGGSFPNLETTSSSVSITIDQLPDALDADKPGIKELLTQLQVAITQDSELSPEDKVDALEQVKTLAEIGQSSQNSEQKGQSRKAIKILKGTVASLRYTAKTVEVFNQLLPIIAKVIGLN